ncbi:MAG: RNA polymerase sigma factor, partial [Methylococcales bacterium]
MSHSQHKRRIANNQSVTVHTNRPESVQAETLYTEQYEKIRAFLMTRSRSADLIEEVLQELYLKLMGIEDWSPIENAGAYLLRMAHNLLIDAARRQSRDDRRRMPQSRDAPELVDQKPSPFEETWSVQRIEIFEQALAELPPAFREILLLNRVEGIPHSQIAKRFGRSISWVEKTIVRTLA